MIDLFWTTVFCASLSILLSFIGYGVIAEKLLTAYSLIFRQKDYKAYIDSWRQLCASKKTLSEISAQDEFAKWARQQRVVEKLQTEFDKLGGERKRSLMTKQFALSILVRVLSYAICAWWIFIGCYNVSMLKVPTSVFGLLANFMAFPSLAAGNLSAPILFVISMRAFKRILATTGVR